MESNEVRKSGGYIKRLNALVLYSVPRPPCIKHQDSLLPKTEAMGWSIQDDRQGTKEVTRARLN